MSKYVINIPFLKIGLGLWCLTPLSTIFRLYRWPSILLVEQPEYPEKTTDLLQVTDKLKSLDLLKDHNSWSFLYTLSLEAHYM